MKHERTYYLKDGTTYTKKGTYIWNIEDLNTERLHGNKFITLDVDDDNLKQVLVAIDDIEKIELREIEDKEESEEQNA